jgi:hypothetical protein
VPRGIGTGGTLSGWVLRAAALEELVVVPGLRLAAHLQTARATMTLDAAAGQEKLTERQHLRAARTPAHAGWVGRVTVIGPSPVLRIRPGVIDTHRRSPVSSTDSLHLSPLFCGFRARREISARRPLALGTSLKNGAVAVEVSEVSDIRDRVGVCGIVLTLREEL